MDLCGVINMSNKLLSVILLSYYSEKRIENVYEQVKQKLENENIDFEFIIIDDGSKDKSYEVAKRLEERESRVRAYQLSKNYTSHYAKFAGFSVCKGDCAVSIPDDFQLPLKVVVKMYRLWEQGHKLIIPFRESRNDGLIKDMFSKTYYKIMNTLSDVKFPPGGAGVFLADREIIDILNNRIHPINTSTTVEVLRLGFDPLFIPFNRPKSHSKSRWTFKKKIKLAKDTFFAFSSFPIKLISILGFLSFIFSILLIIFSIYVKLFGTKSLGGVSIPGWTTTLIIISLFSGLILFSLGMIAEYIWRIYEEVKNRPGYIIKQNGDLINGK